ncbi:MAG: transglutaminase-like domain-containing protein [Candidatus Hodarchaeota archaeon]
MSEFKKELLEPAVTKKQIIGVVIIAGILVSMFAFSVYAWSLIFGTQRDEPSKELDKAEKEDVEPLEPYFPIDLDDLMDWLADNIDDLDPSDLDDLEDLGIDTSDLDQADLDALANLISEEDVSAFLEEMLDGSIDNYDLTMAGLAIAALLFSDVEAFRIYEYDNPIDEREDILWKYECFDQYNRDGWSSTVPMEQTDFLTFDDYYDPAKGFSVYDLIKLKRELSAIIGSNSFVLGSLFPTPYIIEDSIEAPNLDQTILFSDDFGCVSSNLIFNQAGDIDMIYKLFGEFLPTNDDINATAVSANYNPSDSYFQKFLQLPGGISGYINNPNNNDFRSHWNTLNTTISSQDNAFMVANKIRNYLQSNFDLSFDALVNDPPGEGEDVVEWFCEKGEGLYSEFASAFCAFTRSFGVASRFVDGFNSRLITEDYDPDPYYPIKYKNIYNWAEIYVPWDTTGLPGHGRWVQMDILYDSYGAGGSPIILEDFNLTVVANSSLFNRWQWVNITATLSSYETNVDGRDITFTDLTTGHNIGTVQTDVNGIASILVEIDNYFIAGPNVIEASHQNIENYTYLIVDDKVWIQNFYVNPQEINISKNEQPRVSGWFKDLATSEGIDNAEINFILFYKGTNNIVPNPFNPMTTYTYTSGQKGYFEVYLDVQEHVQYGEYEIRADFNGSWLGFPPLPFINASSNRKELNVTKELTYDLYFSINDQPTDYPADPNPATLINVNRNDKLNLSVIVIDAEYKTPASGLLVQFYDYTNGDVLIGTDVSGFDGNASIIYTIGNTNKSGPTLIYARVGSVRNYSYYIVNESIYFDVISGPDPRVVDISAFPAEQFNIKCRLADFFDNSINNTVIALRMYRGGFDYTNFLTPTNPEFPIPLGSNFFDIYRSVQSFTPANNYTLRLDFNGIFDFTNTPYPYLFDLGYLSKSFVLLKELEVFDPFDIKIDLSVEWNPTREFYDEFYPPQKYKRGQEAHFQVNITQSDSPVSSGWATIWDDYSNILLYNYSYLGFENGFIQFNISTNFSYAGIHKIRVQYENYPTINTTYIVINETVNVNAIPTIQTTGTDNVVLRGNGGFTVYGYVMENGTGLRGLRVKLLLLNKTYDNVSYYLIGNPFDLTNSTGNFTIQINSIDLNCPQGEYYLIIDFNGSINIPETPGIILIPNYMINKNSNVVNLSITAGTSVINGYYDTRVVKDSWYEGDDLYVYGNLIWDNMSAIENMKVNITVKDSNNQILATVINPDVTDVNGFFNVTLTVGAWPDNAQIWIYFFPENNFPFPESFYVEAVQIQVFRQP